MAETLQFIGASILLQATSVLVLACSELCTICSQRSLFERLSSREDVHTSSLSPTSTRAAARWSCVDCSETLSNCNGPEGLMTPDHMLVVCFALDLMQQQGS